MGSQISCKRRERSMRPAAAVTAEARLCGPSVQFLRWPSLNRPGCFLPRADIQTDAPANRRTGKQTHRQTDAPARRMPGCSAGHRAPQRPGSSVRAQSLSMHLHRRCKCRAVRRLIPTALNIDARAATPRHAGEGHDFSCGTKARTYAGGSGSQAVDRARYASHSTSRGCRPAPA
jgi:hypothetical protein